MRAVGMQVLTDQIKAKRPGVVIYGIGDEEHKKRRSGHNEDDTPGSLPEDEDPDNIAEHRAIDVMVEGPFTKSDADKLVHDLVTDTNNQARMLYVNWGNTQWARSIGWASRDNSNDPHPGHVHISGEADQDANDYPWVLSDWGLAAPTPDSGLLIVDGELGPKTITKWQQIMGTKVDGFITPGNSSLVRAVQQKLHDTVDSRLVIDGDGIYQNNRPYKTAGALQRYLKSPVDSIISAPVSSVVKALQRRLNENRF